MKSFPPQMWRSGLGMIENFNVYDAVWSISNINRFCGSGDRQVTVGAHSLHCYEIAKLWQPNNLELQFYALIHDFPERYTQDVPGFLKREYGPEFKAINDKIDGIIFGQLGLGPERRIVLGADCHRVDSSALTVEASYVFDKFEPYHWPPYDLYENTDIISDWVEHSDPVGIYNSIINRLEIFGVENETLRNALRRDLPRSHPNRLRQRVPPCSGHAYA